MLVASEGLESKTPVSDWQAVLILPSTSVFRIIPVFWSTVNLNCKGSDCLVLWDPWKDVQDVTRVVARLGSLQNSKFSLSLFL